METSLSSPVVDDLKQSDGTTEDGVKDMSVGDANEEGGQSLKGGASDSKSDSKETSNDGENMDDDKEMSSSSNSSTVTTTSDILDDDNDVDSDLFDENNESTADDRLLIATTLKEEGNKQFQGQDFKGALRTYRKGVQKLKPLNKNNTGDEQVKALLVTLHNNWSMACFKMTEYKHSRDIASKALTIMSNMDTAAYNSTRTKSLYRRAMANRKLGEMELARDDLKEAYKLDSKNKAVQKEFMSVRKEIEKNKAMQKKNLQKAFSSNSTSLLYNDKEEELKKKKEAEKQKKIEKEKEKERRKQQWEDECVKRMAKGEDAIAFEDWEKELEKEIKRKKKKEEDRKKKEREEMRRRKQQSRQNSTDDDDSSDDELTEKELAMLRGYKKTSDGRTTSYFNKELSEHEKSLIGDITPQRLESTTGPTPLNPAAASTSSTPQASPSSVVDATKGSRPSAWNQAGTWEEKDTTEWCTEQLKQRLKQTTAETANKCLAVVTKVEDITGDASVAVTGQNKKKKYIFDYHCYVKFELRETDTEDVLAKGKFHLPDICSTHHEELEVVFKGYKEAPSARLPPPLTKLDIQNCQNKLVQEIRESIKRWVEDFNNKY